MKNMKSLPLRTLVIMLAFSTIFAVFTATAILAADAYPSKPVRLIVPYAPGGGTDAIARQIAPKLSERLGNQFLVENRGGAAAVIGTEIVAKAAPDGYTLLMCSTDHTIEAVLRQLPYDPIKSFTPIAKLGGGPHVFSVNSSVSANSVKEFITLAKQKPGQLIFVTAGSGTAGHMTAELFRMMADIDFKIVHFKGTGPAVIDLIGGHSHAIFGGIIASMPHIKSGRLRSLATSGLRRSAAMPDLPTIAELGFPGFNMTVYYGFLGPANMPAPIVDRLGREIKAILALDEVQKLFLDNGFGADYLGTTEFVKFLEEDIAQYTRIVKKSNIKLD
jgi:tripartite-type tricarboxylate transporter receptor subunit TctC